MSGCDESGDWKKIGENKLRKMFEKLQGDGQELPSSVTGCNSSLNVHWSKERMGDVLRDGSPYPPIVDSHFLYHGTDQDSALSILRDGIQLEKGSSCQDFSDSDGFYVNPDFEQAKKWAHEFSGKAPDSKVPGSKDPSTKIQVMKVSCTKISSTNEPCTKVTTKRKHPAVIVFKTEGIEVIKHLELSDEKQKSDWQDIVTYNRSGRKSEYGLSEPLSRQFKESDYITGPVCEASSIPWGDAFCHWKPSGYESRNQQLCVRSQDLAKKFTSEFMDGIILFGEMSDDMKNYLGHVSANVV